MSIATALAQMQRMLHRRGRALDEQDDERRWCIHVNPIGLHPWMWGGMRAPVYIGAGLAAYVLAGMLHLYWAALAVGLGILIAGRKLSQSHPYWPEILWRCIVQPVEFLDS